MGKQKFYVLGLMSGTSLDGLDLAYCRFVYEKKKWTFKIKSATTINYSAEWKSKLSQAQNLEGLSLMQLHAEYGRWLGDQCNNFIKSFKIKKLDLIASHGHTIFHQPKNHLSFQLGDGNAIHALTKTPVVYDFRSLDVHLGGQGAPLVPIGDHLLFRDYDVCLNIGGIANLSMINKKNRVAFDVCFANMGLNFLMKSIGKEFDEDGKLASEGKVNESLLSKLHALYEEISTDRPSLAREQFESGFLALLQDESLSLEDRVRTFSESIADQIISALPKKKKLKVLITGGGAKNKFLIQLLQSKSNSKTDFIIPDESIIDFKEALIFGFLGLLQHQQKVNVLSSVTQAKRASVSGCRIG